MEHSFQNPSEYIKGSSDMLKDKDSLTPSLIDGNKSGLIDDMGGSLNN